jgi:hypothetical protein
MHQAIRQRFKLLNVPNDLKAVLSNKIPDVVVRANGGSKHFNAILVFSFSYFLSFSRPGTGYAHRSQQ